MRLAATFSLLAAWGLTQAGPPSPPPSARDHGAVAVVRRDGIIFPFASFDKDKWQLTWPIGMAREMPVALADVPEDWWGKATRDGWQLHAFDGSVRPLQLQRPTMFWALCSPRIGLTTSYAVPETKPPVPPEPFAKDGVAINGGVPLEPIERVDPESAEAAALVTQLLPKLDEVEERTVRGVRSESGWRHPLSRLERAKRPFKLEAWYQSPSGKPGWTVSYIEAVRAFAPGPDDNGCGLETLISGWIHHQDGTLTKRADLRGKVTYCDRVGATAMLPFGRVTPRERTYWLFQLSGWENEWYGVAEVGPDKVRHVVEAPISRCPLFPRRATSR